MFFHQQKCQFILGIPGNRLVTLSHQDAQAGNYVRLDTLELKTGSASKVYLKDIPFPVAFTHKVFKKRNAIQGELYLVTNDLAFSGDCAYEYYQKRWGIETYHRSLKQNASLTQSPCSSQTAQLNHVALALLAYSRLEQLKILHKNNHYAMKRKLLIAANQASYVMYL